MRPLRKKLLVAAVGVAAINYAACHEKPIQTGNLMAVPTPQDAGVVETPQAPDASQLVVSGNLMAPPPPPPPTTTGPTPPPDVSHRTRTGNLMPPPPPPPTGTPKAK